MRRPHLDPGALAAGAAPGAGHARRADLGLRDGARAHRGSPDGRAGPSDHRAGRYPPQPRLQPARAAPAQRADPLAHAVRRAGGVRDAAATVPARACAAPAGGLQRSEEHTSELQSLMRISSAVFCFKKNKLFYRNTFFFFLHHSLIYISISNIPLYTFFHYHYLLVITNFTYSLSLIYTFFFIYSIINFLLYVTFIFLSYLFFY